MRIKKPPLPLSFYVVAVLSCLAPNLFAQGLTEPVTVSRVGPEGGIVYSIVLDPSDSNTVYSVSQTGVFKSTDRGTTWSYSGLAGTSVSTIAIAPQSPATVYAGAPGNIFKSLDAGANWSQLSGTPRNLILDAIGPQGALFGRILPTGGLFKSIDGGTTWQQASAGIPTQMVLGPVAIDARNANTLYIVGNPRAGVPSVTLLKSTDGGASWSPIASRISLSPIPGLGVTVDPSNTSTLYMMTETGFMKSTDGGRSWNSIDNGLTECFCPRRPLVIDPQNTATLYALRFDGAIFKSTNAGRNWTRLNDNFGAASLTVDPRDSNTLYAAERSGLGAFKSADGGVTWSGINSGLRATPIVSAVIDPENPETLYAATAFSGLLKSVDLGKTWVPSSSGIKLHGTQIETLAIDPQTPNILYAGTGGNDECEDGPGGVFKSVDSGISWADTGLASCLAALVIDPQTPSTIYAVTDDKGVVKSIDGGGSWNPTALGVKSTSLSALAIDPQKTSTLYAVDSSIPSGLWKSVDGGKSWQNLPPTGVIVYALAVSPRSSGTLYAGTNLGVITSTDGGTNWALLASDIGSVNFLVMDLKHDNTLYAGGPGGFFQIAPPTVTGIAFDVPVVSAGASYTARITGWNLGDDTYFDVQVRAPGNTVDVVAVNWQTGTSASHFVPSGLGTGTWMITGVRAHQDPQNHTGRFAPVSAKITVLP